MSLYFILASGLYCLWWSYMVNTKNHRSFVVFKLPPIVIGGYLTLYAISNLGWF